MPHSLSSQLATIQQNMLTQLPAHIVEQFQQAMQDMLANHIGQHALTTDDTFPNFSLQSSTGEWITLDEQLANGPIIVSFFRGNWCPFCVSELNYAQQALHQYHIEPSRFIAISPQTIHYNQQLKCAQQLDFVLLSDDNNQLAAQCNLTFTLPPSLQQTYLDLGANLPEFNGNSQFELPIPATYIIDTDRQIKYAFVNPNYMERAEFSALLPYLSEMKNS